MMKNRLAIIPQTAEEAYSEAVRCYKNAKENLKKAEIKNDRYIDTKYVREAAAMAYLAALTAINGALLQRGRDPETLPQSTSEYFKVIKILPMNEKLVALLANAYDDLHIYSYYRSGCHSKYVKSGFECVKHIIESFSKRKI